MAATSSCSSYSTWTSTVKAFRSSSVVWARPSRRMRIIRSRTMGWIKRWAFLSAPAARAAKSGYQKSGYWNYTWSRAEATPRRRPPCSVAPVGGGLCPAPLARSVFAPIFRWFGIPSTPCRGRPMCPPGHTSARDPLTGRHTGRPLRSSCKLHRPRTTGGDASPPLPSPRRGGAASAQGLTPPWTAGTVPRSAAGLR